VVPAERTSSLEGGALMMAYSYRDDELLASICPSRALLMLSHAIRTQRLRSATRLIAPMSFGFRVLRTDEGGAP
jgi:hypothetical protein